MALRLQLPSSFIPDRTICEETSLRDLQLSAQYSKHFSLPVQRGSTSNSLDIYRKKRVKECGHRIRH